MSDSMYTTPRMDGSRSDGGKQKRAPFRPVSYDSPLVLIISDAEYGTGDGVLLAVALRATEYKPARLFLLVNYTHAVKTAITSSIPRCALLAMRKTKGGKR